jgi:hypothetical protein
MKRTILALVLITSAVTAQAGGYYRGGNNWAYGGAFLGGAIIGGLLARPYYYAPPPVYYAPPPVYYAPPPVYYAPPVVIDQGTATEAPPGYRWTNQWDQNCNCNRAVLVPN